MAHRDDYINLFRELRATNLWWAFRKKEGIPSDVRSYAASADYLHGKYGGSRPSQTEKLQQYSSAYPGINESIPVHTPLEIARHKIEKFFDNDTPLLNDEYKLEYFVPSALDEEERETYHPTRIKQRGQTGLKTLLKIPQTFKKAAILKLLVSRKLKKGSDYGLLSNISSGIKNRADKEEDVDFGGLIIETPIIERIAPDEIEDLTAPSVEFYGDIRREQIRDILLNDGFSNLRRGWAVKAEVNIEILFQQKNTGARMQRFFTSNVIHFSTRTAVRQFMTNEEGFDDRMKAIDENIAQFTPGASDFLPIWIIQTIVRTHKYKPKNSRAGNYFGELPRFVRDKKCVVNIKNNDDYCSIWCYFASKYPQERNKHRVSKYIKIPGVKEEFASILKQCKTKKIDFPLHIKDIPRFEKIINRTINVFTETDKSITNINISDSIFSEDNELLQPLDLFIYNKHFSLITDFNTLCGGQISKHKGKKYFCRRCMHGFCRKDLLIEHSEYCLIAQKINMPEKDTKLEFTNHKNKIELPYIVYSDFETLNEPMDICSNNPENPFTDKEARLTTISCGFKLVCRNDPSQTKDTELIVGRDCAEKFLQRLLTIYNDLRDKIENVKDRDNILSKAKHKNTTSCYLCKTDNIDKKTKKVKSFYERYDEISGEYLGSTCAKCSNYQFKLPVVFHNLRAFDAHLLIEKIGLIENVELSCIPNSSEKYACFSMNNIQFLDSYQFMACSLDKLVEGLDDFSITEKEYEKYNIPLSHLRKKGHFPYEWFTSEDCLKKTRLPDIEDFYSKLSDKGLTKTEYKKANDDWEFLECKTFKDYHDHYLRLDVCLLADVFESFRSLTMLHYKLDGPRYVSLPGLSFDAALLKTGVKMDLLNDPNMYLFFEQALRGGLSGTIHRHATADNKYINEDGKNPENPCYIIYKDAVNLYGYAMVDDLPVSDFKWMDNTEIQNLHNNIIKNNKCEQPCYLEVDIEYSRNLHKTHDDYPLCAETKKVNNKDLSDYQKNIMYYKELTKYREDMKIKCRKAIHKKMEDTYKLQDLLNIEIKYTGLIRKGIDKKEFIERFENKKSNVPKLICSLTDKYKYKLHYKYLNLVLEQGLKLKKIHRVITFKESDWLKEYIMMNTELRKKAKNDFEKNFYKLANNSIFGKSCENLRRRIDFKLVNNNIKKYNKLVSKPNFKTSVVFNENLVGIHMSRAEIKLDKPIYMGVSILDLSKIHMADFHYNVMKKTYGDRIKMMQTDTDSYIYRVHTEDIYEDMKSNEHYYDFSEYKHDEEHHKVYEPLRRLWNDKNKKIPGKFSDQVPEGVITNFCGLRSKMYSYEIFTDLDTNKHKCVAKGVQKAFTKKNIRYQNYVECLESRKEQMANFSCLRSTKHIIFRENINKTSLSAYDDKRFICADGISTHAFGYNPL